MVKANYDKEIVKSYFSNDNIKGKKNFYFEKKRTNVCKKNSEFNILITKN